MKKFFAVSFTIIAISTILFFARSTSAAEKPIVLTFSYHAPAQSSLTKAMIVPWVTDLEKASGGRIKINQYAGGSMLGAAEAYDGVVSGVCDIAQVATEEYPGRFPLSEMHILPFMYPSCELAGIVGHILQNKYCANTEMKDVKILMVLPIHAWHFLGNKPIEKLEDFKGLKMRGPGRIDGMTLTALGAIPVNVLAADMFSALDRGLIDGTVFTWSGTLAFGIQNVTKYKTELGLARNVHFLVMNKSSYAKLPANVRKIFDDFSTPNVSRKYAAAHDKLEPVGKAAVIKASGGKPVSILSANEKARIAAALQIVRDSWAKEKGITGKAIMNDDVKFVKQYSR